MTHEWEKPAKFWQPMILVLVQDVKMDWYSEPGQPYQTLRVSKKTGHIDITATIPKTGGFLGTDMSITKKV